MVDSNNTPSVEKGHYTEGGDPIKKKIKIDERLKQFLENGSINFTSIKEAKGFFEKWNIQDSKLNQQNIDERIEKFIKYRNTYINGNTKTNYFTRGFGEFIGMELFTTIESLTESSKDNPNSKTYNTSLIMPDKNKKPKSFLTGREQNISPEERIFLELLLNDIENKIGDVDQSSNIKDGFKEYDQKLKNMHNMLGMRLEEQNNLLELVTSADYKGRKKTPIILQQSQKKVTQSLIPIETVIFENKEEPDIILEPVVTTEIVIPETTYIIPNNVAEDPQTPPPLPNRNNSNPTTKTSSTTDEETISLMPKSSKKEEYVPPNIIKNVPSKKEESSEYPESEYSIHNLDPIITNKLETPEGSILSPDPLGYTLIPTTKISSSDPKKERTWPWDDSCTYCATTDPKIIDEYNALKDAMNSFKTLKNNAIPGETLEELKNINSDFYDNSKTRLDKDFINNRLQKLDKIMRNQETPCVIVERCNSAGTKTNSISNTKSISVTTHKLNQDNAFRLQLDTAGNLFLDLHFDKDGNYKSCAYLNKDGVKKLENFKKDYCSDEDTKTRCQSILNGLTELKVNDISVIEAVRGVGKPTDPRDLNKKKVIELCTR